MGKNIIRKLEDKKFKIVSHYSGSDEDKKLNAEEARIKLRSTHGFMMNTKECPLIALDDKMKPLFSEAQKNEVAKILGTNIEKLDPRVEGSYWDDKVYSVDSSGKVLDLNTPYGFMNYLIIMSNPSKIACGREELDMNPSAKWLMINDEDEVKTLSEKAKNKFKTFELINKHSNNPQMLRDMLSLYVHLHENGKIVGADMPIEKIKNELLIIADENPTKLYLTIEGDDSDVKILLTRALQAGAIVFKNTNYYAEIDQVNPIGQTLHQTIEFLKSPANAAKVSAIKDTIAKNTK